MFELVRVFVLLLVQVNEVVCDALLAARLHVPADLEGITGDVADLDILRNRELLHLRDAAVLGFTSCVSKRKKGCFHSQTELLYLYSANGKIFIEKAVLESQVFAVF